MHRACLDNACLESRQIGLRHIARRDDSVEHHTVCWDVLHVVRHQVLAAHTGEEAAGRLVRCLRTGDERLAQGGRECRVLSIHLLRAAPARIDGEVEVGRVQRDAAAVAVGRAGVVRGVRRRVQEAVVQAAGLGAERRANVAEGLLGSLTAVMQEKMTSQQKMKSQPGNAANAPRDKINELSTNNKKKLRKKLKTKRKRLKK